MTGLAAAFALLLVGALAAALCGRRSGAAAGAAVASAAGAAVAGLLSLLPVLSGAPPLVWESPWAMPWGGLALRVDPLSAFFALFVLVLAVPFAAYGKGYLSHHGPSGWTSLSWSFYLLLVAAMVLVVTADDGFLLLLAWEGMAVSSLFLVLHDHEKEEVRRDGLVYAVAAHLGAAALVALFALWGARAGSLRYEALAAAAPGGRLAWVLFLLALAGFGSKAGLVPFHIWLPRAHPAAPSHVSALLSGVMVKMGVYGLMRVLLLMGPPRASWGFVLMGVGAASALGGVVYALAQRDLKRLLAYSTVENVGIITLALGAAFTARAAGMPGVAALCAGGALLHTLNHGLFKGLLFCAGGAAAQAAGSRDLESLGGLLRRMPLTGAGFLAGAAALCALPPLNGFAGEFLLYAGLLRGGFEGRGAAAGVLFFAVPALALCGGLALACFAKAAGVAFLGEPRSAGAAAARDGSAWMTAPVLALAGACLAAGLGAPFLLPWIARPASVLAVATGPLLWPVWEGVLTGVSLAGGGLLALLCALLLLRRLLLGGRPAGAAGTWGCGYTAPTERMQYSGASFSAPLLDPVAPLLRPHLHLRRPEGFFPRSASFASHWEDLADRYLYGPLFGGIARLASALRPLQQGRLQIYLFYILMTLLALLVWGALS